MNRLPLLSVIQVLFGFALESQNYPAQILTSLRARLGQLSAAPAPPANHCSELFLLFPTVAATETAPAPPPCVLCQREPRRAGF